MREREFTGRMLRWFFILSLLFAFAVPALAETARERYAAADACYQKLRGSATRMKYRDNWLRCIDKYKAVYAFDPSGPWAAAGLYQSGRLYLELSDRSFLAADRREARDIFERVIKRYPASAYKSRAMAEIRKLAALKAKKNDDRKSAAARKTYDRAEACYRKLCDNPRKMKYRDRWLACIEQFEAVYDADSAGPWADAGLYRSGELYRELYQRSYRTSDKTKALDRFQKLIREFPDSTYRASSETAVRIFPDRPAPPERETRAAASKTDGASAAAEEPASAPDAIYGLIADDGGQKKDAAPGAAAATAQTGQKATITGLRYWSNPNYTRVVIDADGDTTFLHRLLKKDPAIQKPQRLFVDLESAVLAKETSKVVPINDDLLSDVRAGQYTADAVRVVIDIKSFKTYKIFSLKNPFRIVIDVWGETGDADGAPAGTAARGKKDSRLTSGALAKQLALGVSRIVIDAGHGGRDYGAPGYLKGVHEKYIVLSIAKRLARKVRAQLDCEVIMTRTSDRYLTLEERTAIANTRNADLFISIHTNSARDRRAYGLETYFLNLATDDEAILVAARENATSTKNISDLQTILNDLMHNAKVNESSRLAVFVQDALHRHMKLKYSRIKNKGVKQAPFYVLLGAQMPSILIETSFISNPRECRRLNDPGYQDQLCEGILEGIRKYIRETNPTAIKAPADKTRSAG